MMRARRAFSSAVVSAEQIALDTGFSSLLYRLQLAGLHAWSGDPEVLDSFSSGDTPIARDLLLPVFMPGWEIYRAHTDVPVPAAVARFAERFAERAVQERSRQLCLTLTDRAVAAIDAIDALEVFG